MKQLFIKAKLTKQLIVFLTLLALCITVLLTSLTSEARDYGDLEKVELKPCYDGDTCTFHIPGLHPIIGEDISVRLRGLDTPEIKGKCQKERDLAIKARDRLRVLLKGKHIILKDIVRGNYFRIVATLIANGQDVSEILIREGLARPYGGGKRKEWCF